MDGIAGQDGHLPGTPGVRQSLQLEQECNTCRKLIELESSEVVLQCR
jgi:hypothetical protein